jgi:hypothetical protein
MSLSGLAAREFDDAQPDLQKKKKKTHFPNFNKEDIINNDGTVAQRVIAKLVYVGMHHCKSYRQSLSSYWGTALDRSEVGTFIHAA